MTVDDGLPRNEHGKIKTGGGKFDPNEPSVYFLAGHNIVEISEFHPWNLVAANDVQMGEREGSSYNELSDRTLKGKVLFDSGIFWLTNNHMKAHPGMTMDEALTLAPDQVDGFDALWDTYVDVAQRMGDDLWGYIELDQGGAENKKITRGKLEALGLRPIPVYHPLLDGWDYFDELCQRYDRICLGNVVQANRHVRKHLLSTLWERHRLYPDVWIHVLGYTPNEYTVALPLSSCDSSSWVYAIRWGAPSSPGARAMGDSFGNFPSSFSYDPGLDRLHQGGQRRGVHFLSSEAYFQQYTMRTQERDLERVFGVPRWPAFYPGEPEPEPWAVKLARRRESEAAAAAVEVPA